MKFITELNSTFITTINNNNQNKTYNIRLEGRRALPRLNLRPVTASEERVLPDRPVRTLGHAEARVRVAVEEL